MLAAMYFFLRGTPFIYQGQELGTTNVWKDSVNLMILRAEDSTFLLCQTDVQKKKHCTILTCAAETMQER